MEQYTISSEHASVIAIDQHARSVTMLGIDFATGEEKYGRLANCPSAAEIAAWAESWATKPIRFVYEALRSYNLQNYYLLMQLPSITNNIIGR